MKNRAGFTLIECMIYVFVLGVIALLFFSGTMRIYSHMRSAYSKNHLLLTLYTAGDVFARDLRQKPPINNEIFYRHDGIAWRYEQTQTIGWSLEQKNTLVRHEGSYNYRTNTWSGGTKSIVCTGLTDAQFTASSSGACISMSLVSDGIRMERAVWL
jgi:prepilin-type N-terminal cleavage/methylation domain-containing protein